MNNKGFTLVELLAVLIVLTTILLIAIPSITSSVERNKEKLNDKKIEVIESSAREYAEKFKNKFDYNSFITGNYCISVDDIKNAGLLTEEDLLDADESNISGCVYYYDEDGDNIKEYVYSE